jgi:hypothetical protein
MKNFNNYFFSLSTLAVQDWFFHSSFDVGRLMFDVHLFQLIFPEKSEQTNLNPNTDRTLRNGVYLFPTD